MNILNYFMKIENDSNNEQRSVLLVDLCPMNKNDYIRFCNNIMKQFNVHINAFNIHITFKDPNSNLFKQRSLRSVLNRFCKKYKKANILIQSGIGTNGRYHFHAIYWDYYKSRQVYCRIMNILRNKMGNTIGKDIYDITGAIEYLYKNYLETLEQPVALKGSFLLT